MKTPCTDLTDHEVENISLLPRLNCVEIVFSISTTIVS